MARSVDRLQVRRPGSSQADRWKPVIRSAAASPGGDHRPKELIVELRSVTVEHNRVPTEAIRNAAARDDRRVADEVLVPSFLWSSLNGLADHVTSERRGLDPFPMSRLLEFAAERLAVAITQPNV